MSVFYVAEVWGGNPLETFDGRALFDTREEAIEEFNQFVRLLPEREFGVYELVKIAGSESHNSGGALLARPSE